MGVILGNNELPVAYMLTPDVFDKNLTPVITIVFRSKENVSISRLL